MSVMMRMKKPPVRQPASMPTMNASRFLRLMTSPRHQQQHANRQDRQEHDEGEPSPEVEVGLAFSLLHDCALAQSVATGRFGAALRYPTVWLLRLWLSRCLQRMCRR